MAGLASAVARAAASLRSRATSPTDFTIMPAGPFAAGLAASGAAAAAGGVTAAVGAGAAAAGRSNSFSKASAEMLSTVLDEVFTS